MLWLVVHVTYEWKYELDCSLCSFSTQTWSRATHFGNLSWFPVSSTVLSPLGKWVFLTRWIPGRSLMIMSDSRMITSANMLPAAELLAEPATCYRKPGSLRWTRRIKHGRFDMLYSSRATLKHQSPLKNESPCTVSPPTLPSEHPKLDWKALPPRINWIKISPIWNVHLILGNDVSNICKRFLY